jgi:hypothetical protein
VLPEDRERHLEKVRRIAAQGGSYNSEFRIRRPDDGRIVWLEERAEAEVGADGAVERVMGVTLDISERKRSEVALRENEAWLAGLSEATGMSDRTVVEYCIDLRPPAPGRDLKLAASRLPISRYDQDPDGHGSGGSLGCCLCWRR